MPQQIAPDTIGPYTLDCLLGTGGMGEVYKAFDPRLDRWVAVKHIKADYALKAGYRRRLEREAKTIASLDHPSIVQIYDVIRDDDGGEWIVMELVDGPTVYDMLEEGPLELGTTLTIGLDVIHGLAVAHDQGVLHRDLKSENVMVSRKGIAKILDFGLSKRLTQVDEATLSMEGKVIGTCRVMAPEQADGQELDGRADLFAFGILLYEMVTARSPFRASTPMASMLKAFGEPHAPVHSYNPDVPQELSDLIDWLLSKNRDHRPENALVVAAELTDIVGDLTDSPADLAERIRMASRSWHGSGAYVRPEESSEAVSDDPLDETIPGGPPQPNADSSRATRSNRMTASVSRAAASRAVEETLSRSRVDMERLSSSPSRWSSMFSTALGVGLSPSRRALVACAWLLALITGRWAVTITRPAVPEDPEDARIMVLPFANHGPDEMAHFAAGLTDELIRELTGRRGLAVVSYRTSAQYASSERKSLRAMGDELEIGYVIEGSVASERNLGDNPALRISLRLNRVSDGTVLLSRSLDRTASDTLRVQSEIADAVAAELGAQIFVDSRTDLSTDPMALDAYFRGIALSHGSGYSLEALRKAERFLETAVEEDPDFERAWVELAEVRSMIFFNWHRTPEAQAKAEQAVSRARALAPSSISVLLASGFFEYHVLSRLDQALMEFRLAAEKAPSNPKTLEAIGLVLRRKGELDDAVGYLERAFDLDRANSSLAGLIAETERGRRAYRRAERWFRLALQKESELPYVVGERAENQLALRGCGDLGGPHRCAVSEALAVLQESDLEPASLWFYRVHLGVYELANSGDPEAFLALYESVPADLLDDSERLQVFWRRAMTLQRLGRVEEAQHLAKASREELSQIAAGSQFGNHHALLALALALEGKLGEAEAAMRKAREFSEADPFTGPRVKRWAAVMAVWAGKQDEAIQLLLELSQMEHQFSLASYEIQADPAWQPIRNRPEVREIWNELRRREIEKENE